jgi:hypothetical protein
LPGTLTSARKFFNTDVKIITGVAINMLKSTENPPFLGMGEID